MNDDSKLKEVKMFDFESGPVPAHRHPNEVGWVADTARVDASCVIAPQFVLSLLAENEALRKDFIEMRDCAAAAVRNKADARAEAAEAKLAKITEAFRSLLTEEAR